MSNKLEKYEIILGCTYCALEFLVLPVAASALGAVFNIPYWALNCGVFIINFVAWCAIFHRFLWGNVRSALIKPGKSLGYALIGLVLYYIANILVSIICYSILADYVNLNDENVSSMVLEGGALMTVTTAVLVPVSEELLFRGLLFRGVYDRCPWAAWLLSAGLFSLAHIVGYIGLYAPVALLVSFLQYLPAGFCFCFVYKETDTILAPIFMHIAINSIALALI